ncbi:MAG: hypothetical protein WKG07_46375 [Hymenobacter sp.]
MDGLKDGATVDQARAELDTIAARLERQYPTDNTDQGVTLSPLLDSMVSESRPVLLLLSAAVIVVLLVACANVANLLLARGAGRLREFALRRSDRRRPRPAGAPDADRKRGAQPARRRRRGLLLAYWATRALTGLAATGIPRADQIGLNVTVLAFAVAAAMLTSVVFGLLPALHLTKHDSNDALKEGGRSQGAALGRTARELLIVAEVAMSIVLLIGAGLLIRSPWQLQQVNPGFCADKVVAMEVSLPTASTRKASRCRSTSGSKRASP